MKTNRSPGGSDGGGLKSTPLPSSLKRARTGSSGVEGAEGTNSSEIETRTPEVEIEHVRNVYDSIASHWHGTRYKAWPKVEAFITSQPKGSLFADIGCGNGKNMVACNHVGYCIGSDISFPLGKIAAERHLEVLCGDIVRLPYRDGAFDCGICIAVLHHISTEARRKLAIQECMRVIRPGGSCLFYAWAKEQTMNDQDDGASQGRSGHRFADSDNLVPWHLKRPQAKGQPPTQEELEQAAKEDVRAFKAKHATFSEEKNAFVFQRYCHVYTQPEIEALVDQLEACVSLESIYWDTGNWAFILKNKP